MAFHRVPVSVVDYSCKSAGRKGSRKREKSGDWEGENTVGQLRFCLNKKILIE